MLNELEMMVQQPAFWVGACWMLVNVACWKLGRYAVIASRSPDRVRDEVNARHE